MAAREQERGRERADSFQPTAYSLSELQSLDRRLRRSQSGLGQELLQE
jgi:hypothetical protein